MVVDTEVDTVVAMEEDMAAMEAATEDMDTVEKREKLMLSLKPMLLLTPMPIMVMEVMEADMAMVGTEDTGMGVKGDQLNPATDMAVTEEAMEAMVDMVVMEVKAATDMDIMVEIDWNSNHTTQRTKELET